jgi:hypothetical protein
VSPDGRLVDYPGYLVLPCDHHQGVLMI